MIKKINNKILLYLGKMVSVILSLSAILWQKMAG